MNILLTIYLIISLLTFGFIYLCSYFVAKKFKVEHPTAKFRKVGFVEKVIALLRTAIISLLLAVASLSASATIRVYKGYTTAYSNLEYIIEGNRIYKGYTTSYSNIVYTIEGNRIYKGYTTSYSNLEYIIEDNRVYKGYTTAYSNLEYIIEGNHVYKGYTTAYSNIVYTLEGYYADQHSPENDAAVMLLAALSQ